MRAYFFGCWDKPGHYLYAPSGIHLLRGTMPKLDSGYAPRRHHRDGSIRWAEGSTDDCVSSELPQGQFLRHSVNDFTIISWWDRSQGDTRFGSNSTFLLEGEHDSAAMVAALAQHFPHVVENLRRAGVELVDVTPESK